LTAFDRLSAVSHSPHEVLTVLEPADEVVSWVRASPLVARVASGTGMIGRGQPSESWYSLDAPLDVRVFGTGAAIVQGRLPLPDRADEVFVTVRTSKNSGLHVGDVVSFRAYGRAQTAGVLTDPWMVPSGEQLRLRIVGIARDPTDAQRSQSIKLLFGTPAFARAYATTKTFTPVFVWLKAGPGAETQFERELAPFVQRLPNSVVNFVASRNEAQAADQSARPVAIGLLIFALVAALAGLVTMVEVLRRGLAPRGDDDRLVLSALGATRADRTAAQMIASLPYLAIATVIAVATCYASSALFPIGATRALEPSPGLRADALVLLLGGGLWFLVLLGATGLVAWSDATEPAHPSAAPRKLGDVTNTSLPLPAALGLRFSLRTGSSRTARRRAAFAGSIVAVVGVVGSLVFAQSLDAFSSTPTRFGLGFDLSIEVPSNHAPSVLADLAADHDLSAIAVSRSGSVTLDGKPVMGYSLDQRKGTISATARAGALPERDDEIALGPQLLRTLHKRIGEDVELDTTTRTRKLRIVGTVLSPTSEANAFNAEAVLTSRTLDAATSHPAVYALVRGRPGADLKAVTRQLASRYPYGVTDESAAAPPGQVRNLQQVAHLPLALALFFALLGSATVAQGIFLTTAERRRDLAVLRGLGFTHTQVRGLILVATATIAAAALIVGIPIGIFAGTFGWRVLADALYVAPTVTIPTAAIIAACSGLLSYALVIGIIPGHLTVRQAPAAALHAE
jgi:predicted lysophospholipase L1 biosynthesis ABC-type transport system permease subunit